MLLHLSDLHFGTQRQECLDAIQRFCLEHEPEVIVVSGDLTQRARYHEFYQCKQFLQQLNLPYFVVPGNHDIPLYHLVNRIFRPFHYYQLFFGDLEPILETQNYYLIGLNTVRPYYHTKAVISNKQIMQVQQQIQQAPVNKLCTLVSHQPFYTAQHDHHHRSDCPAQAESALRQWGGHGLNVLLHGHFHLSAVYDLNQHFQLGLQHGVYEVHAGTSCSNRLYKKLTNSFNVIYPNGEVQHYDFSDKQQAFILRC
ncbi:metallophosphoesterase [Acinetobacter rudis]|uniref:Calcineurin-like phosphoesterase domain-containing protein n=1 Tax=Acinetobacter rudis CIP 110305 TaxID=421052 RepID=S3NIZ2_9GAMM|nr:metallophosphoesterase [Acinetobacter rudis]EPF80025.1 hypothetical protein F945_00920 [Acinetobacter rudis CIP 110305]